jgi:CMP-N,N'-diacetyllegionaminic acid synthase
MPESERPQVLQIIPARGGSKGIPRKNMALIGGKPLVDFAFQAALAAKIPGRICLSTDDDDIRKFGLDRGAEVPFLRPSELAQDDSSTISVVQHALDWYEKKESFFPDSIILLQPTCPFRTANNIAEAYRLFQETKADALISVNAVHDHPCEYIEKKDGSFSFIMPPPEKPGRQNFPKVYFINGAIYIARTAYVTKTKRFFDRFAQLYVMARHESLDIDEPFDLEFANWLYEKSLEKGRPPHGHQIPS